MPCPNQRNAEAFPEDTICTRCGGKNYALDRWGGVYLCLEGCTSGFCCDVHRNGPACHACIIASGAIPEWRTRFEIDFNDRAFRIFPELRSNPERYG